MTLIRGPVEEHEERGGAVGGIVQGESGCFVYDATSSGVR